MNHSIGTIQLPNDSWINTWQFCSLLAKSELASTPLGRHVGQWAYDEGPAPPSRGSSGRRKPYQMRMTSRLRQLEREIGQEKVALCWEALAQCVVTAAPAHLRQWWPVALTSPNWDQLWYNYQSEQRIIADRHRAALQDWHSQGKLEVRDDDSDFAADKRLSMRTSITMISALGYLAVSGLLDVTLINVPVLTLILSRGHLAVVSQQVLGDARPIATPPRIALHLGTPANYSWSRHRMPPREAPNAHTLDRFIVRGTGESEPTPANLGIIPKFVQPYHRPEPFLVFREATPDPVKQAPPPQAQPPLLPEVADSGPEETRMHEFWSGMFTIAEQHSFRRKDRQRLWELIVQAARNHQPPFNGIRDTGIDGQPEVGWIATDGSTKYKTFNNFWSYAGRKLPV